MEKKELSPIEGDPKRQAIPTLQGFAYQIWQSLYAWLSLEPEETLYLEGGEDIDLLSEEGATAIQVKRLGKNVTLRSEGVVNSIAHYWQYQQSYPGKIHFRFLTTASRGYEQGRHFNGVKGLDYWDSCKRGADIAPLARFLVDEVDLPATLKNFLKSAKEKDIVSRLVSRIEWDTGRGSQPFIEQQVSKKILLYGSEKGYRVSEAEKTIPTLLKHIWDVVCRDDAHDRRLEYIDFIRLFEDFQTERISRPELKRLRHYERVFADASLNHLIGNVEAPQVRFASSLIQDLPSLLEDHLVQRNDLVREVLLSLQQYGFLSLYGSTGMGKSVLATFVAKNHGGHWKKVSLRGFPPTQIRFAMDLLAEEVTSREELNLILDDVNFRTNVPLYENSLSNIIYLSRAYGNHLILTTQDDLPHNITLQLGLPRDSVVIVPRLGDNEIRELTLMHGCPKDQADTWSKSVQMISGGHPQLAHARVRALEQLKWPTSELVSMPSEAKEIKDLRREERKRLRDQLPTPEARELAVRVSVFTGFFKRKHALALASSPTRLNNPGLAFDFLIGPYVEKVGNENFQLSPLLSSAATESYSQSDLKLLHQAAGEAFLAGTDVISQTGLSNIFMHGFLGESSRLLSVACIVVQKVDAELWPSLCQYIYWVRFVNVGTGKRAFKEDPSLSLLIRSVQFRVAAEVGSNEDVTNVAAAWERELRAYTGQEITEHYPFMKELLVRQFYVTVLTRYSIFFRIDSVLKWSDEFIGFISSQRHALLVEQMSEEKQVDWSLLVIEPLIQRLGDAGIDRFLKALEQIDNLDRILSLLDKNHGHASRLTNSIWLQECKSDKPDWTSVKARLNSLALWASEHKVAALVAAAFRAIAIVEKEYCNDDTAALKTLELGYEQVGYMHPILEDYRAKIAYLNEDYAQALPIWQVLLPRWKQGDELLLAFSYRQAGICAAYLGNWQVAASLALEAKVCAEAVPHTVLEQAYYADYAFALWHQDRYQEAITAIANILDRLPSLPDPRTDLQTLALVKLLGQALLWMLKTVGREYSAENSDLYELPPGAFSNTDVNEGLKDLPLFPSVSLWALLAELEHETRSGKAVFKRAEALGDDLPVLFRQVIANLRVKVCLLEGRVSPLVLYVREMIIQTKEAAKESWENDHLDPIPQSLEKPEKFSDGDIETLFAILSFSLMSLGQEQDTAEAPWNQWQADAEVIGISARPDWHAWIERLAELQLRSTSFSYQILKNTSLHIPQRLLAAVIVSLRSREPGQQFYANVILVHSMIETYSTWRRELEGHLASMLSLNWMYIVQHRRFALRSPSINVDEIQKACNDVSRKGLSKAASIILAAQNAVDVRIPTEILSELHQLKRLQ